MKRLSVQDTMLTQGQGGVLPELADPTQLRQVLDVRRGTGNWLLETARTYPMIEKLVGADMSRRSSPLVILPRHKGLGAKLIALGV